MTSFSLDLGRARDTTSLCKQTIAIPVNLGFLVLQAIRKGVTKFGLWLKSVEGNQLISIMPSEKLFKMFMGFPEYSPYSRGPEGIRSSKQRTY